MGLKDVRNIFIGFPCCCSQTSKRVINKSLKGCKSHFFSNKGLLWVGQTPVAKPAFATRWTWPQVSGRGFFWWMCGEWGKPQLVSETVFVDDADHLSYAFCDYEAFGILTQHVDR